MTPEDRKRLRDLAESDPLDLDAESRSGIADLVALGRGRFDEYDAECAARAVKAVDSLLAEVRRLREENARLSADSKALGEAREAMRLAEDHGMDCWCAASGTHRWALRKALGVGK